MKIAWPQGLISLGILILWLFGHVVKASGREALPLDSEKLSGKELAIRHCGYCHQFTNPELLPKKSWEFLLTYMGFFLGVVDYTYLEGSSERTKDSIRLREELLRAAKQLPAVPLISKEDWKTLRDYYVTAAPSTPLLQQPKPAIIEDAESFVAKRSQYRMDYPITSLVYIDEQNKLLIAHDSRAERLTVIDSRLRLHDSHDSPGVSLIEAQSEGDKLRLLSIGDLFAADIGRKRGELQEVNVLGGVLYNLKVLAKGLHRPADFEFADLDNDGSSELIVANFGDYTGDFSIYWREKENGPFRQNPQVLSHLPGIVKCEAHDFNGDGRLDIALLSSAAREGFHIFVNDGDGTFSQKTIFEKNPSFGYTGFELRDFDSDRRIDLLTINGDNGDSDPYNTLKRDHGIRIYLGRGNYEFEEVFFYPMYGAYEAEVEDFDKDGDYDIAAISFHPDFNQSKRENFVYLEQVSPLVFSPSTHPATYDGRWLRIHSGDLDGDGDKDIVLGAAHIPVGMSSEQQKLFEVWNTHSSPLLYLENRLTE